MKPEATVFVGNLTHMASEEDIKRFFEEVGPTKDMRLPTDKDTGRRRGYGFVEMADAELAEAARRHLNGRELKGRAVRIDLSNDAKAERGEAKERPTHSSHATTNAAVSTTTTSGRGKKREHREEAEDDGTAESANELIGRKLNELSTKQLFDLLRQVKTLAESDFMKARQILLANPQLTQVLHASCLIHASSGTAFVFLPIT